jgi:hypothetical protein
MASYLPRPSQEFVDALLLTTEREAVNGELWCPLDEGELLKRLIANRSREIGGLLRQAVRIFRLMARASERGYLDFLYVRLLSLRGRFFEQQIDMAWAQGRLIGIVRPTERVIARQIVKGVLFEESEMAAASKAFQLDFGQMPRAAAFIDVLHNMLGFPTMARLCEDILGPRCHATAEEVAHLLGKELNAWLHEHTVSDHYIRQARVIRNFLISTTRLNKNEDIDTDSIDDQAIIEFWEEQVATDSGVDGFRLYRSAAQKVIAYRDALNVAATEENFLTAVGLSESSDEVWTVNLNALEASPLDVGRWVSPLAILLTSPAERVKWLFDKQREILRDLLPDGPSESDDSLDDDGEAHANKALFSGSPPDPRFFRTLARYSYFGKLQTGLVDQAKKGVPPSRLPKENGYEVLRDRYLAIADQLEIVAAATAWALLLRRHPAGVTLAHAIDPAAVEGFAPGLAEAPFEGIIFLPPNVEALARRFAEHIDLPGNAVGARLRAASRKVKREGFRPVDSSNPQIGEGLAAGADAILAVVREVRKMCDWLARPTTAAEFTSDLALFRACFQAMYGVE